MDEGRKEGRKEGTNYLNMMGDAVSPVLQIRLAVVAIHVFLKKSFRFTSTSVLLLINNAQA